MSSRSKALLAIVLASLLWSTAGLAKILILELNPFFAAFLRALIASLVILPFFLRDRIQWRSVLRDVFPLSLASAGNILFYYLGLMFSTANAGSLINAGIPLITLVLSHILIGEKLKLRKMAGILVGLFGVILITLLPILTKGGSVTGHITGNIFFVVQIFIWSLYTIGSRHLTSVKGYSPTTISGISFFTTTFVFGLISIFTVQQKHVAAALVPSNILLLLYLGIFVTVITYLLYQWAIKYSSATTATLNSYIGPVFAIGINCLFLGESITLAILFGLVLILSGLWMIGGSDVLQKMKGVRIR